MAAARDTFIGPTDSASGALSITQAYTCTGSNRFLIVYVADQQGDTVTGVTYSGTAMTQLSKISRNPNAGSLQIYAYGIIAPATGSNNIIATRTGTAGTIAVAPISYTGVNQSITPDAVAATNGSGAATTITTSITTVADNTAVSGFAILDNGTVSAGTGWTMLNTARATYGLFESTAFPLTPAGTYSYTATENASAADIAQIIISLAPVASAALVPKQRPILQAVNRASTY
jgi:hypothetical protein